MLPFTNVSTPAAANQSWLAESIPEALRQSLLAKGAPAISRDDVMLAFSDLKLRPATELTQASVLKLGQTLDADRVVFGTYRIEAESVTIEAMVSDRSRARVYGPFRESGLLVELDRLEAHLAWQALSVLLPGAAGPEGNHRALRPAVRVGGEENFIRGLIATTPADREKFYIQAARADPRFARPALELGKIELARKNFKAAADWLTRVESADTSFPEASFYLGVARFRLNDLPAAQAAFERITEVLPAAEVFNNLGVVESRRNSLHALSTFREALEVNPSQADYHFNMGFILFKTGQFDAAADRFRAVLERNPADQTATILLGRALKADSFRKGSSADARLTNAERFKDSLEEPTFRAPVGAP
jgi:tetratricopeptide (TPR) repeat protein